MQRAAEPERLGQLLLLSQTFDPPRVWRHPFGEKAAIRFENVSFRYPSRPDQVAIDCFNLAIEPGERIGLWARPVPKPSSGCCSDFTTWERAVLINGWIFGTLICRRFALVGWSLKKPHLRIDRVGQHSIRAGRCTLSDDLEAARVANADEFIKLPEGYDTYLGERGARLSGGQKQRIALAREIVRDPPILLLDEATSASMLRASGWFSKRCLRWSLGRTTLIIAHRLSTVLHADRIVLMEQGQIAAITPM